MRAACPPLLLFASVVAACSSSASTAATVIHPTLMEVAPEDFLGAESCVDASGADSGANAIQGYVATLFDVTLVDAGLQGYVRSATSGSLGLVSCFRSVVFSPPSVVALHRYAAEVDGYDRTDIGPLAPSEADPAPDPRIMVDGAGTIVAPLFTRHCRGIGSFAADAAAPDPDAGTLSYPNITRRIGACDVGEAADAGGS